MFSLETYCLLFDSPDAGEKDNTSASGGKTDEKSFLSLYRSLEHRISGAYLPVRSIDGSSRAYRKSFCFCSTKVRVARFSMQLIASKPVDRTVNQQFHIAALTGDLSALQTLLIEAHLPIDCRDKENSTALLLACARGHESCVEYLLSHGADPNARRLTGATSLYFATSYHHTRIVELLLKKYNAYVDLSTFDGSTPLHVACERGFIDIVQLLIDHQASINTRMNDGTTAIMLACQNGHLSIVQMLVGTGQCDLLLARLDGVSPLFLVVQRGHEMIFDYLMAHAPSIHETIDLAREDGATPMFKACQKGYDSLAKKILIYKPNLEMLKNGESVSWNENIFASTLHTHSRSSRSVSTQQRCSITLLLCTRCSTPVPIRCWTTGKEWPLSIWPKKHRLTRSWIFWWKS